MGRKEIFKDYLNICIPVVSEKKTNHTQNQLEGCTCMER